ncbi:MAG: trigger factor [Elusimicrobia bacterium]|nr:trigger factor [Elusimicrobiota bacterium]
MKVDVLAEKGCLVEINIEIPAEDVKKEIDVVFSDIQKNATIDGFRKGHAPMDFVKREFARTALEKAKQNLMQSAVEKAIKEKNLQPVVTPVVEPNEYVAEEPFSFKLKIENFPKFTPKNFKKVKITKKIKKISDKEINAVIENLQDRQANLTDAGDVTVEPHHFLIADYEGTVDGKKMGKLIENQTIDLSHKSLPEGFAAGLVGMRVGENRTVETKISGKPAKFDIKVKAIKNKVLPKADDDFAKDLGHKDVAELREKVKDELVKTEDEKSRQDMENQIIENLLKSNDFAVPETLVEEETNRLIEKTKQYFISNRTYQEEEFKKSIPAMKDKYKTDAEKTVRISYLLSRIAKDEDISVSMEDVNRKIEEFSGGDKKVAANYDKHREYIMLQMKEKKLFDFLLENAKIKEVKA